MPNMLPNKLAISLRLNSVWICVAAFCLCGCSTIKSPPPDASSTNQVSQTDAPAADLNSLDVLRPNDLVSVYFSGIPNPPETHNERINEKGQITLQLLGSVTAAGKSAAQLQEEIQQGYVPKYFQRLVVTVQTENRFFFVRGEVKNPSRLVYAGGLTVLKAIAAAGDFTDFAQKKSVELRRMDGRQFIINANKARRNKALDLPVVPGDEIFVPRRLW
jgi:polysaccharide biosynthesis/export protein VpsN